MSMRTKDPGRRAMELMQHLHARNCSLSREAAECVRRVLIELMSDADCDLHSAQVEAHEEGR